MNPNEVSAVLVTRGDVEMRPIIDSIEAAGFEDVVIWNNSEREDLGIYGRYAAITEAEHDVIVTQDDDVIVECWPELLAAYQPGVLTVNYQEPWDIPWVARGSIFDWHLPSSAFNRYLDRWPKDALFTHWICDAVFGLLTDAQVLDLKSRDLPHGFAAGRVSTSAGWYDDRRPEAQRRCEMLKPAHA